TEKDAIINELEVTAPGLENAKRKVKIIKIQRAYDLFHSMIRFYGITHLMAYATEHNEYSIKKLSIDLSSKRLERTEWLNVGGQLIPEEDVLELRKDIRSNKIQSWDGIHEYYVEEGERYEGKKTLHAITSLLEIEGISVSDLNKKLFTEWVKEIKDTKQWMVDSIEASRKKDYTNPFRKMMYDTQEELDEVLGKFEDNSFIKTQKTELEAFIKRVDDFTKGLNS